MYIVPAGGGYPSREVAMLVWTCKDSELAGLLARDDPAVRYWVARDAMLRNEAVFSECALRILELDEPEPALASRTAVEHLRRAKVPNADRILNAASDHREMSVRTTAAFTALDLGRPWDAKVLADTIRSGERSQALSVAALAAWKGEKSLLPAMRERLQDNRKDASADRAPFYGTPGHLARVLTLALAWLGDGPALAKLRADLDAKRLEGDADALFAVYHNGGAAERIRIENQLNRRLKLRSAALMMLREIWDQRSIPALRKASVTDVFDQGNLESGHIYKVRARELAEELEASSGSRNDHDVSQHVHLPVALQQTGREREAFAPTLSRWIGPGPAGRPARRTGL